MGSSTQKPVVCSISSSNKVLLSQFPPVLLRLLASCHRFQHVVFPHNNSMVHCALTQTNVWECSWKPDHTTCLRYLKSTTMTSLRREILFVGNTRRSAASHTVMRRAFGDIYVYWLQWKCLIIEYHVFQSVLLTRAGHMSPISESKWRPEGAGLIA